MYTDPRDMTRGTILEAAVLAACGAIVNDQTIETAVVVGTLVSADGSRRMPIQLRRIPDGLGGGTLYLEGVNTTTGKYQAIPSIKPPVGATLEVASC